jgi:hypothetical protein
MVQVGDQFYCPPWSAAARRRFVIACGYQDQSGAGPPHSKEANNPNYSEDSDFKYSTRSSFSCAVNPRLNLVL